MDFAFRNFQVNFDFHVKLRRSALKKDFANRVLLVF